jgi:hypothetical protein
VTRHSDWLGKCGYGFSRHWFTYYGWPGSSSPTCVRCGVPNPKYDPDRDPKRETR